MRRMVFIILISFLCLYSSSQEIEGKYINDIGETIVISKNKLYYIARKTPHLEWWEKDTLAICKIKKSERFIYRATSLPQIQKAPSVECTYEERGDDSICVNFVVPYNRRDLEITVNVDDNYATAYKNVDYAHSVMIPRSKRLSCSIRPTQWIAEHEKAKSYAYNCYFPFFQPDGQLALDPEINRVDIKIPELNDYFFAKYFVIDEYIYIKNNCLHWKGKTFNKMKH